MKFSDIDKLRFVVCWCSQSGTTARDICDGSECEYTVVVTFVFPDRRSSTFKDSD